MRDKKTLYQRAARLQSKIEKMQTNHAEEIAKLRGDSFQVSRVSNNPRGWLSPSGNIAVSIRRNMGNTACALIGHVILDDISASSVARAEIRTGAALMAQAKGFFEMCRHVFRTAASTKKNTEAEAGKPTPTPIAVHSFRQDATNSGVWKRSKLAAMELESFFTDGSSTSQFILRRLADVQKVSDGSAKGTVAMTKKQMESLGCPTWSDLRNDDGDSGSIFFHSGWNIFLQTTDRGSNELAARQLNAALYDCGPRSIYIDNDCLEHATHLCVMAGLAEADSLLDFKYFASCAVLGNVLRDIGQILFPTWANLFGDSDALLHARRLFPKALSGRWGSVHDFEERCLQCTGQKLSIVLKRILDEKIQKTESSMQNPSEKVAWLTITKQCAIHNQSYQTFTIHPE